MQQFTETHYGVEQKMRFEISNLSDVVIIRMPHNPIKLNGINLLQMITPDRVSEAS